MSNKEEAKEIRDEQGQWAAIKHVLSSSKDELSEDFEQLEDDVENLKTEIKGGTIDKVTCQACKQEVESPDVERCSNCGYDANGHNMWRWIHAIIAGFLCATLIGIPLAIIPFMKLREHAKKQKRGVVKVHRS